MVTAVTDTGAFGAVEVPGPAATVNAGPAPVYSSWNPNPANPVGTMYASAGGAALRNKDQIVEMIPTFVKLQTQWNAYLESEKRRKMLALSSGVPFKPLPPDSYLDYMFTMIRDRMRDYGFLDSQYNVKQAVLADPVIKQAWTTAAAPKPTAPATPAVPAKPAVPATSTTATPATPAIPASETNQTNQTRFNWEAQPPQPPPTDESTSQYGKEGRPQIQGVPDAFIASEQSAEQTAPKTDSMPPQSYTGLQNKPPTVSQMGSGYRKGQGMLSESPYKDAANFSWSEG